MKYTIFYQESHGFVLGRLLPGEEWYEYWNPENKGWHGFASCCWRVSLREIAESKPPCNISTMLTGTIMIEVKE